MTDRFIESFCDTITLITSGLEISWLLRMKQYRMEYVYRHSMANK